MLRGRPVSRARAGCDAFVAVSVPATDIVGAAHEAPRWPALPLDAWRETKDTLHLWTQIVGKVRLALAPRSVADFYRETMSALRAIGVDVRILPRPVELTDVVPFDRDKVHASYDGEAAQRFWRVLVQADRVLHEFRRTFIGKCSPAHFWWGSFDLSCTRFSGRRAPTHPGGVPNCPDYVTREAYSHECISAGWWPGGGVVDEPAFHAYAYPEPVGCATAAIRPTAGACQSELREWILPYDAVRTSADADGEVLAFLESTYDTAATLGGWDRAALERPGAL